MPCAFAVPLLILSPLVPESPRHDIPETVSSLVELERGWGCELAKKATTTTTNKSMEHA